MPNRTTPPPRPLRSAYNAACAPSIRRSPFGLNRIFGDRDFGFEVGVFLLFACGDRKGAAYRIGAIVGHLLPVLVDRPGALAGGRQARLVAADQPSILRHYGSEVKSKIHYVPVADDTVSPFETHTTGVLCPLLTAICDKIGIGNRLGADEPPLEIGMDPARGLRRLGAPLHSPGMSLFRTDGEKRDQIEERIALPDHLGQTRLVQPQSSEKLALFVRIGELRQLRFDCGRDYDSAGAALCGIFGDALALDIARCGARLLDIGDVENRFRTEELECVELSLAFRSDQEIARRPALTQARQHRLGRVQLAPGVGVAPPRALR